MQQEKVDSLKRVSLLLESGTTPEQMDLTSPPVEYAFIVGTGAEGLTPFEYEIVNKSIGDEVLIPLRQSEIGPKFEHMAQFIAENINMGGACYLKATISNITAADNRAIVKAMAETVKQGHDCDCECGCGG